MYKRILAVAALSAISLAPLVVSADGDPSVDQIYQAANSGQIDRAQTMIQQVLRDHPDSAKAHYVAAELDARQHRLTDAREQLQTAEHLKPGLPFVRPESVRELKAELGQGGGYVAPMQAAPVQVVPAGSSSHLSFGPILLGIGFIVLLIWIFNRRRSTMMRYPASYPSGQQGYGGGYGNVPPPGGGGLGSNLAGGLATGIGVGAGIAAGEALADRLIGGGRDERPVYVERPTEFDPSSGNSDMGGSDFGVNDSGSWDDSGGGGGGDDWS